MCVPQVVFEMKKKEIEKARTQLEEGRDGADFKVGPAALIARAMLTFKYASYYIVLLYRPFARTIFPFHYAL